MKLDSFIPLPLPPEYKYLEQLNGMPKVVQNALKFYGLREIPGAKHNPLIIAMGKFLGGQVAAWISNDEDAWCGTFAAYIIKLSGFEPPAGFAAVRAREYAKWGNPSPVPALGDILAFWRGAIDGRDGHVGFYVGETATTYIVLGGNQGNKVSFTQIEKKRLIEARRCPWRISQPAAVKPIIISQQVAGHEISGNEA